MTLNVFCFQRQLTFFISGRRLVLLFETRLQPKEEIEHKDRTRINTILQLG